MRKQLYIRVSNVQREPTTIGGYSRRVHLAQRTTIVCEVHLRERTLPAQEVHAFTAGRTQDSCREGAAPVIVRHRSLDQSTCCLQACQD